MTVTVLHLEHHAMTPEEAACAMSPVPLHRLLGGGGPDGAPDMDGTEAWRVGLAQGWLARGLYRAVAEVATDRLAEAWRLTQNGAASASWSRLPPPRVRPLGPGVVVVDGEALGYRSSALGDLLERDGRHYVVGVPGYVALPGGG